LPIFIGGGNCLALTHAHRVDFLIGISGGTGGLALGLPMICGSRKKLASR